MRPFTIYYLRFTILGRGATGRRQAPTGRAEPYRIASISSPTSPTR